MARRGRHKQKRSRIWRTYENKRKKLINVLNLAKTNAISYRYKTKKISKLS